jgi:hypothetical protein
VFVSVFVEMLGPLLFWLLVLAIAGRHGWFRLGADPRSWSRQPGGWFARRWQELLGGVAAVLFMQWITNSGFRDIGGPVDLLLVVLIFVLGAIGAAILAYTVQAVVLGEPDELEPA